MIHIWEQPEEGIRLKSFGGTIKGVKSVLKIEIEIDDPTKLGFYLADLARLDHAQKQAEKKTTALKMLALPAPKRDGSK